MKTLKPLWKRAILLHRYGSWGLSARSAALAAIKAQAATDIRGVPSAAETIHEKFEALGLKGLLVSE